MTPIKCLINNRTDLALFLSKRVDIAEFKNRKNPNFINLCWIQIIKGNNSSTSKKV